MAIGAQNAYVLRQGLAREHVGLVVAICALSDVVLIVAGVSGIGTIVERAPGALDVVRWLGVAFLTWYGVAAAPRADAPTRCTSDGGRTTSVARRSPFAPARAHLAQPARLPRHRAAARLDRQPRGPDGRWWFAGGAAVASTLWFCALGYGARLLAPLFARPRAWQVLDVRSAS